MLFFNPGPMVQQILQAHFGSNNFLSNDLESSILMERVKADQSDRKMQKALAVFYNEPVHFYAESYIHSMKIN